MAAFKQIFFGRVFVMRLLLSTTCVLAGFAAWSQAKINHYSAPINHPAINVSAPYLSLEGNSLLFVSDNAEDNVLTVFWSTKPDGVNWKAPVALPKTLNGRLNFLRGFSLSADGRTLAFVGIRGGLRLAFLRRFDSDDVTPVRGSDGAVSVTLSPDGREVLVHIKKDSSLKLIPVVILTTSEAEADIVNSYQLQANCYLSKPVQLEAFYGLIKSINEFWLTKVKLPQQIVTP